MPWASAEEFSADLGTAEESFRPFLSCFCAKLRPVATKTENTIWPLGSSLLQLVSMGLGGGLLQQHLVSLAELSPWVCPTPTPCV